MEDYTPPPSPIYDLPDEDIMPPPQRAMPGRSRNIEPSTEQRLANLNRTLPYSDEAEKGLLSGMLVDPRRVTECAAKLPADMFYHSSNRIVFEAVVDFMQRDIPLDIATLTSALRQQGNLDKVGGPGFISQLYSFIPVNAHWEFYRKQVVDKWLLRRLVEACAAGIEFALENGREHLDEDALQALTRAEEKVFGVLQLSIEVLDNGLGPVPAKEFMHSYVDHLERVMANVGKVIGLHTGLHDLDRIICGLDDARGELMVIGARPGHGKTALLGTFLLQMCVLTGIPTLAFSMEMSTDQLMDRVVFGGFGINTNKARTGMLSEREQGDLMTNIRKVQNAPLWIDESGELTTVEFRARVDMMVRQHGIKLLIIDYLQLLEPCTKIGKTEERLAITEALKVIHALKKKHKLVILCAAQLNQNIEKTPGRRHVLSDFAGSDAIGKYADYALFIVRPAEIKRWKDLDEKKKQRQIDQWHEARYGCPEAWAGTRILGEEVHPLDEPSAHDESDAQPKHGQQHGPRDGAESKPDFSTTAMRVHDGSTWLFENEREWDESAELQLVKNRNGPTPDIPVRFRREFARFEGRTPKLYSNDEHERQSNAR